MRRTRVEDWLIGAAAMLLLLCLGAVVLWLAVSEPSSGQETPTPPPADAGAATDPPAGLADDEVWLGDLTLDAGTVVAAGSTLRDVRAVGQDVVSAPEGTVAGRLDVDATVPFDVVAGELGGGSEVGPGDDGQATVVRAVELLGREVVVTASGTVEVEDGSLVVEPRSIDIGGPDFLAGATAAVVRGLVTIEHEIEGLPEGLVLQDVVVQDDGFRATLRGEDVRLAY